MIDERKGGEGLRASSTLSDLLAVVPATTAASSIANPKRVNRVRREELPSTFQAEGGAFTVGSEDALFRRPTQQVSKTLKPPVLPRSSFQSRNECVIPSIPDSESDYDRAVARLNVAVARRKR